VFPFSDSESLVAAQTDIFCFLDFFLPPVSRIQQPAYGCRGNEYQDNWVKLKKQKKQEHPDHQDKNRN
jgi:hypothetical protein